MIALGHLSTQGMKLCVSALEVVGRWGKKEIRINHIYWNCVGLRVVLMFIWSLSNHLYLFESWKLTANVAGTRISAVFYNACQSETGNIIVTAFGISSPQLPRISIISNESFILVWKSTVNLSTLKPGGRRGISLTRLVQNLSGIPSREQHPTVYLSVPDILPPNVWILISKSLSIPSCLQISSRH